MILMMIIETPRLIIRNWQECDFEAFAAMNADPEVMFHFPSCLTEQESRKFFERLKSIFEEYGHTFYACERKDRGECIGFIGTAPVFFEAPFTPATEIGWRLSRAHWGQGFATEGALAVLRHAFHTLKLSEIVSFTVVNNRASRRVMEKIGLTHNSNDDFDHPRLELSSPLLRHVLYRINAEDYLKRSMDKGMTE